MYYKMSDDEEIKGDNWNATNNNVKLMNGISLILKKKLITLEEEESEADNEADEKPKNEVDAFVYERLREELSPRPPINDPTS